jgi:hypothetical protein
VASLMLVLALALGGCAFGARNATLRYPPAAEPASGTARAATAATPTGGKAEIALTPFADERRDVSNKTQVGSVRNGFSMPTAQVVTKDDIRTWVTGAVRTELVNAGYRVVDSASGTAQGLALAGDLSHLWCDAYFTYTGEVTLAVRLRRGGQDMLLNQSIQGYGSAGTNWGATAEAYGQTLSLALADALRKLIVEIDKVVAGR